jgi:hypothetical protein
MMELTKPENTENIRLSLKKKLSSENIDSLTEKKPIGHSGESRGANEILLACKVHA